MPSAPLRHHARRLPFCHLRLEVGADGSDLLRAVVEAELLTLLLQLARRNPALSCLGSAQWRAAVGGSARG